MEVPQEEAKVTKIVKFIIPSQFKKLYESEYETNSEDEDKSTDESDNSSKECLPKTKAIRKIG